MHPLSAQDILQVWELGQRQHPVGRALTMLAAACPDMMRDKLACLSIGQRDACLLTLREQTFGAKLNGFAECTQCKERTEFTMNVADIRVASNSDEQVYELTVEGFDLRFHLPNSLDLAAIINCNDQAEARSLLVQRCLLQVNRSGAMISSKELSEEVTARFVAHIAECDPQSEVLLNLKCPACSYSWQIMFDIVSFFWTEICAQANRLLHEVHILAIAYGWCEEDILSLSTDRRQFYLEMVS
ncbi:MAG: hypothetical protein WA130_12135 [Candidatus Methanoperedens sp.]